MDAGCADDLPAAVRAPGRALGRYVIMAAFRFYLASLSASRRCSFDLEALDALRDEPSLIIAPNHPCLLDALMVIHACRMSPACLKPS